MLIIIASMNTPPMSSSNREVFADIIVDDKKGILFFRLCSVVNIYLVLITIIVLLRSAL